jgi:hypothetical protein
MISNLDSSEFVKVHEEENLVTPRVGAAHAEGVKADAPPRDFNAEANERNWKFHEAIAQEEIKIQNAKLTKLKLELEALELDNREQALAIKERTLAIQAREREVERTENFVGKGKSDMLSGTYLPAVVDDGVSEMEDDRSIVSTSPAKAKGNKEIIKRCMTDLYDNMLESNEVGHGLAFVRRIQKLAKFRGTENPLNFLSEGRLQMFEEFYSKFIQPKD